MYLLKITRYSLLFFLGIILTPSVYANIRVNHCTNDCGRWLVGSVKLERDTIQWTGNQVANSIVLKNGIPFGFSGPSAYLPEPKIDNQWGMGQFNVMVMGNALSPSPSIGHFFAPEKEGGAFSSNYYEAIIFGQSVIVPTVEVRGQGVADNVNDPAITLNVNPNILPVSCPKDQCISLTPQQKSVIFTIDPNVRPANQNESISGEIEKTKLVMVELLVQEDKTTGCSPTISTFKEANFARDGGNLNNFSGDDATYFHYLQIQGPDSPPTGCTRAYSFLTGKDNIFHVTAINQKSTGKGFVSYTFYIRGHDSASWEGKSRHTYYLTTDDITPKELPEIKVLDGSNELANDTFLNVDTTGKTITIQNEGTAPLALSAFALSGDFQLDGEFPTTVEVGSSKSFTIKLSTTKAGEYSGKLEFKTNDTDESSISFPLKGKVESKALTAEPFKKYQECLDFCVRCAGDAGCEQHEQCKNSIVTCEYELAKVTSSDLNIDDFCKANPTMEVCIMKKVCSGKPEACGITGGGGTAIPPTIAQCKETCKDDPFGCVGITDQTLLDSRTKECSAMMALPNPTYRARKDGEENVSVLYLPMVDVESFLTTPEVKATESRICVGNISVATDAEGKPDLSKSIFQVIGKVSE